VLPTIRQWTVRTRTWSPQAWDVVLYGGSVLFALLTIHTSGVSLYRQWALIAIGPYAVATALSLGLCHRRRALAEPQHGEDAPARGGGRRWKARAAIFFLVLVGATLLPLSLEVAWRSDGISGHVQPEVAVIEHAAHRLTEGQDPYRTVVRDHRVVLPADGQPAYELFFPYLPLMTVFGLPSSTHEGLRLTDARIFLSLTTLVVVAGSLGLSRAPVERRFRTLQALTVLPIAALPLATGGDDMVIVGFLLLAMVLAQRRRPGWSGLVLGVVSAMKFTAWPLAALALFAARDREGRRAPVKMLLGMAVVIAPVVAPFLAQNATAFVQNVVLFPLGLSGVSSPAASPLPGHLLVTAAPVLGRIVTSAVALVGAIVLVRRLVRRPPRTPAEVTMLAGWVMTVAILIAPATRIGYLLYPINFFIWSWLLRGDDAVSEQVGEPSAVEAELDQKSSETWISSSVNRVDSAPAPAAVPPEGNVVGAATMAASQYQPSEPPFWASTCTPWPVDAGPVLSTFQPPSGNTER
jgi:hypothetical protein